MQTTQNTATLIKTSKLNEFISAAVEPFRAAIEKEIFTRLSNRVDAFNVKLAEHGWDSESAFPFPRSTMRRADYVQAKANHDYARKITVEDGIKMAGLGIARHNINAPAYRLPRQPEKLKAENEKTAKEMADASVNGWINKMVGKVASEVCAHESKGILSRIVPTGAKYQGGSPWEYSFITLDFSDGSVQKWKTMMIVNVSSLGTLFNQFPSRLVK